MAEIELGRGRTPLPAGFQTEAGGDQRCVVRLDDTGYHVDALESLTAPSWRVTYTWETVRILTVEPIEGGVAIVIADDTPGHHRVEVHNTTAPDVEAALEPFRARTAAT